jgi:large subunit ribosomal protein L21
MYAIIKTGGKQFRVAANDILHVEKLAGKAGDVLTLDQVLLIADGDNVQAGKPTVTGAKVTAKVIAQRRGTHVHISKFKRRGGYYNRMGHRQALTTLKIETIALG